MPSARREKQLRKTTLLLLIGSLAGALACSESLPTSPEKRAASVSSESERGPIARSSPRAGNAGEVSFRGGPSLQPGVWGSDKASLRIAGSTARLEILAATLPAGGCFGAFGDIDQAIPNGRFKVPGTYTQLTGVYPGKTEYAAVYTGSVQGNAMSIAVTIPSLSTTVGPFSLTYGIAPTWSPCHYP